MTERFILFEVKGGEMEGQGWWVSMLGFFSKNQWDYLFLGFFEASGAVGATLLHPWVVK